MTPTAIFLILASAFMHAGWNFVSKRRNPSLAFFLISAVAATAVVAPLFILYWHALLLLSPLIWLLVLLTGGAQTIYLFGLAGAYRRGDISLAYPLARALPVLFIAGVSFLLGKGGEIGRLGLVGMLLITAGCLILPLREFRQVRLRDYFSSVYVMALIAAIGTTSYTLIDDSAMRMMRLDSSLQLTSSEVTLLFIALQTASTAVVACVATLWFAEERQQLRQIMAERNLWLTASITGIAIMATYGLALAAMAYVSNVSYVAAFRQLSIPIGAVLGMTLQNEPRFIPKVVGIGVVSVGLVLVGLG